MWKKKGAMWKHDPRQAAWNIVSALGDTCRAYQLVMLCGRETPALLDKSWWAVVATIIAQPDWDYNRGYRTLLFGYTLPGWRPRIVRDAQPGWRPRIVRDAVAYWAGPRDAAVCPSCLGVPVAGHSGYCVPCWTRMHIEKAIN
jgi:hypothetical protein